ncbi:unnamed protein product [Schistosoma margrebowiei]|uniref:MATH domain-containing protein n=1 Tax=Schistosoma margrebowiei TaxID=48269 RepID=A0AA85ABS1_9TREM|nr:unnamed protein product [Schistosoma margrebowiei]
MNNQLNTTNKQTTLQLYRIIKLNNEHSNNNNNQIFTFIIPPQFIKGFLHSVQSNEFYYAGHYWYIRMEYDINTNNQYNTTNTNTTNTTINSSKQFIQYNKQPLGISIHLCHLSNGLLCHLKSIKFTIPHQYNYTLNLIHQMNNLYFTNKNLSYQLSPWIQSNLLLTNQYYLFDNDTCLLEIELNQLITIYEEQLHISKNIKDILHCKCIESTTFTYSNNDWSFIIDWNHLFNNNNTTTNTTNNTTNKDIKVINDYRPKCYLQKHNTLKHWIRIQYLISIHWYNLGEFTTDILDHLINPDHSSITKPLLIGDLNWFLNNTITNMIKLKHKISIKIHFYSITYINLIQLIPTLPHMNQNCTQFIDPYGIEWFVISDILGKLVHLKLFYLNHSNTTYNTTINNNNKQLNDNEYQLQVRSTAWSIQLIPYNKSLNNVKSMSPFYVIYTSINNNTTNQTIMKQNSNTNYQEIVLNLDVEKVCSSNFGYSRPSDNAITLHIEWLYSHVLCRGDYQNYDELIARQRYHLLRDISNKDLENEHLNKLKQVQVSTSSSKENDHHDHDHDNNNNNQGKLSESNINSVKQSSYLRKSSEILPSSSSSSSSKSYFQDSFKIKKTSTHKGSISPNHSISSGNSLTNSLNIKHFLTPSVIINNNNINLDDDSSSTNQSWRRHSSCLEEVGTTKPRQRRQLPSPPPVPLASSSSSSLKLTEVILPEDVNTISSIDRFQTTRTNNNNSPRLSLKHEHSNFGHFI